MTSPRSLSRRRLITGLGLGVASHWLPSHASTGETVQARVAALEQQLGGRIGLMAIDTGSGARWMHREHERFAMCSTFKLLLAAAILAKVDRGELLLTQSIPFSAADVLDHAPVIKAHLPLGKLSVETLAAAIIEVSDNTAANLLLPLISGPSGFNDYLRTLGDSITRLDRIEPALNSNLPGDARDTTTPHAMVTTMDRLLIGDALSTASRNNLFAWMKSSSTGLARLRAGLPADWTAGDKTGSGLNGAVNDVAIVWPPGRAPILMTVYMSESMRPLAELNAAHAAIAKMIAAG